MTRKEANQILHCPDTVGGLYSEKYGEALNVAMQALEQEPCEAEKQKLIKDCKPPMDDWEQYADRLHDIAYKRGYEQAKIDMACEDTISRQAVLDKLNRLIEVERLQGTDDMGYGRERVSAYECMIAEIESEYLYPSVSPTRPKGHWIEEPNCSYRCSNCGEHYISIQDYIRYKFCPNCGADMRGNEE